MNDLTQYLRLHARDATFDETVQHARRYITSVDAPKGRKGIVKINAPPAHETNVNALLTEPSVVDFLCQISKGNYDLPQKTQPTPKPKSKGTPKKTQNQGKTSSKENVRSSTPVSDRSTPARTPPSSPMSRDSPRFDQRESRSPDGRPFSPRPGFSNRPPSGQSPSVDSRYRGTASSSPRPANYASSRPSTTDGRRTPPPRSSARDSYQYRRVTCFVCGTYGCHSSNHRDRRQPTPSPNRARYRSPSPGPNRCYTCGEPNCRPSYHTSSGARAPTPLLQLDLGNGPRASGAGPRAPPTNRFRPNSH